MWERTDMFGNKYKTYFGTFTPKEKKTAQKAEKKVFCEMMKAIENVEKEAKKKLHKKQKKKFIAK